MKRIILALLLAASTAQSDQVVVDVPPIATGRTVSSMFILTPDDIVLTKFSSTFIGASVPFMPGYELTDLSIYLGGFHGPVSGEDLQPGWHGTINGMPIAPTTIEPVLVSIPIDDTIVTLTADAPDQLGLGAITFGRALTPGVSGTEESTCSEALPVFLRDCQQASQQWTLAFRAVFQSEPWSEYASVPEPRGWLLMLIPLIAWVMVKR